MKKGYFLLILVLALGSTHMACSKDSKTAADSDKDKASQSALKAGKTTPGVKSAKIVKSGKSAKAAVRNKQTRIASRGNTFHGRIILVKDDMIEMKYGRTEMRFRVDEGVEVVKLGEEAGIGDAEICQTAKATYKYAGKKKVLVKLSISKESDCYR